MGSTVYTLSFRSVDIVFPVVKEACDWTIEIVSATGQNQKQSSRTTDVVAAQSLRWLAHSVGSVSTPPLGGWEEGLVQTAEASVQVAARVAFGGNHHFESIGRE
jgi:hypothetical protein